MTRDYGGSLSTLIETNILVYAAGADGDRARQRAAILALENYRSDGALGVQVLAEFANVLMSKGKPMERIRSDINILKRTWKIVGPDANTVLLALMGVDEH
jgi:predicted nucleic acid-binding protein